MSAAVAHTRGQWVTAFADSAPEDLRRVKSALTAMRLRVELASAGDAMEILGKARLVRELAKLAKHAGDIAAEACRLECFALRRIGQLPGGPRDAGLPSAAAACARDFAAIADDRWAELMAEMPQRFTPYSLRRHLLGEESSAERRAALFAVSEGRPDRPVHESRTLRDAAEQILEVVGDDEPLGTMELASRLATRFGISEDDSLARQALGLVARAAFNTSGYRNRGRRSVVCIVDPVDDEDKEIRVPLFVAYREEDLGLVHIPFDRASLEQFEEMVAAREKAAAEVLAVASELRLLHDAFASVQSESAAELTCGEALKLGQQTHQIGHFIVGGLS